MGSSLADLRGEDLPRAAFFEKVLPWDHHSQIYEERIYQGLHYYYSYGSRIVQKKFFSPLTLSVSKERIEAYRRRASDTSLDLFARYSWNIALSEALYPSLNVLEVALRNDIHGAMSRTFHPSWLDNADPHVLKQAERQIVIETQQELWKQGRSALGGNLITELTLGFWTRLFNGKYDQLWHKLFKDKGTFSALPRKRRKRKTLSGKLNRIRKLRNRVFHHEPIWHIKDLAQIHSDILQIIYWLNPTSQEYIEIMDRFPDVYNQGFVYYRKRLEGLLKSKGYI